MVVKKDGTRERFERQKLVSGLLKACEKRPVSVAALETNAHQENESDERWIEEGKKLRLERQELLRQALAKGQQIKGVDFRVRRLRTPA